MPPDGLTIAVLGAGGTIAPPIVLDLAESPEAERLKLLDIDGVKAAHTAREFGGAKSVAIEVDGREEGALEAQLSDVDLLINSASYRINVDVMEACLASGTHYIDLGGLYHVTAEQLKLDQRFRAAGLLGLLGMGSAPGKTNLLAAVATQRLGGRADRIEITAGGRDLDPPDGFAPPYSVQTLLDELTLKPVVLRDGMAVEIDPMSDGGQIDFPDPIGDAPTIYTLHSEILTFGESFGCSECSFRLSLGPAVLERLTQLTTAPAEDVVRATAEAVKPSAQTVAFHLVDAWHGDRRVRAACRTNPKTEWGLGGGVLSTSAPAAAAVRLFARGQITARGVLPPERAVEPDALFAELAERGTEFSVLEYDVAGGGR